MFRLATVALVLLFSHGSSIITTYDGNFPYLEISAIAKEMFIPFKLRCSFDTTEMFVLGEECQNSGTCTTSSHSLLYAPIYFNASVVDDSNFTLTYRNSVLTGARYTTEIQSSFERNIRAKDLQVIENATIPLALSSVEIGIVGLGFTGKVDDNEMLKAIFNNIGGDRQIMFRRGRFEQYLRTQFIEKVRGTIAAGFDSKRNMMCNYTTRTDQTAGENWSTVGTLKINDKVYLSRKFTFSLDQVTSLPADIYDAHYKSVQNESEIPSFSVIFKDEEYTVPEENFAQYETEYRDVFKLYLERHESNEIRLGLNFLSEFCLYLNFYGNKPTVGLAYTTPVRNDPVFEDYSPPKRPDNNKEDDDDDKENDRKSTASISVSSAVFIVSYVLYSLN